MSNTEDLSLLGTIFPLALFILACIGGYLFYNADLNGITIFSNLPLAAGITIVVLIVLGISLVLGERLWGGQHSLTVPT